MTTTISVVCPKCGKFGKSGKRSCCGRGGSWFKNCGSPGNTKLAHTWSEGIQACKASLEQSKLALGQPQLNPAQQKRTHASNDVGSVVMFKGVKPTSARTTMGNISTRMLPTDVFYRSTSMTIIMHGSETLLKVVARTCVVFLLIVV